MRRPTLTAAEVKALRKALGLTQESFAHEVGVSCSTINRWEKGHARVSRLGVRRLAELAAAHAAAQCAQAVA